MKKLLPILLASALSLGVASVATVRAADVDTIQISEFLTIRWDGRDNSFVVRPNGKIEKLKDLFARHPRPDGIDERIFYLTIAMNAVAKEGFEFAGALNEHVVMKRTFRN